MNQEKIWNFYQNDESTVNSFDGSQPRYEYIANKIAPGLNILNIGVGRGGLEDLLIKKGCVVNCLDPSPVTIDEIRKKYNMGDRAKIGFSQSIPFEDFQFDVVVVSEVLEHLSDDVLNLTIFEIRRILKKNGLIIITVPANENLVDNKAVCPHCGEIFHRWGHLQSFTRERLRKIILTYNFEIIKCELRSFPNFRRSGSIDLLKSIIRHVLGRIGVKIAVPNIYMEARVRI